MIAKAPTPNTKLPGDNDVRGNEMHDGELHDGELHDGDPHVRHARWIARVLDDWYVDPIIGFLVPGLGDFFGAMFGFYIVVVAVRRNVSRIVVARMLLNLTVDAVAGAVPIVGDLFDAKFKANRRNLHLLLTRSAAAPAKPSDWLFIAAASTAFSLALVIPIVTFFWLFRLLLDHV